MFAHALPLFTTMALLASGTVPHATTLEADLPVATCAVETEMAPPAPLSVTARLVINPIGNGYYQVIVTGTSTARNAQFGVRVYGEDTWFDDFLFSMGIPGYSRTDGSGYFSVVQTVYRSTLNEDWEGTDEIYAIVDVSGGGSSRTNLISRSF